MSYTEIYKINKKGDGEFVDETRNAFRGAMQVWRTLEEKYLESLDPPAWAFSDEEKDRYHSRSSRISFDNEERHYMQDIWDLGNDEKVSLTDRIVMNTTFDNVLVRKENLQLIIDAFKDFEFETSLPEQATILEKLIDDEDCIAVGWNQTSVVADSWNNTGEEVYNEEYEEMENGPYNINKQETHWFLFESKKELQK